jgi:hypothetical protein
VSIKHEGWAVDIKESMASSERAGKLFYVEHHGVAVSNAASRYILRHALSLRPLLTTYTQCLRVWELGRATSLHLNNASGRVAMHASL